MFATKFDAVGAYSNVGVETAVTEASPHRLVVLLFEGAKEAIILAKAGIEAGDIQKKGVSISKAIDIILNGLRASLNMEEGGDLSQNLYALYDYMARRLLYANVNNDIAALDEVFSLLSEIHSAWVEIGENLVPSASTTSNQPAR